MKPAVAGAVQSRGDGEPDLIADRSTFDDRGEEWNAALMMSGVTAKTQGGRPGQFVPVDMIGFELRSR